MELFSLPKLILVIKNIFLENSSFIKKALFFRRKELFNLLIFQINYLFTVTVIDDFTTSFVDFNAVVSGFTAM